MYLLGYDIGSSSIKAALVDAQRQETVAVVQSPQTELPILAHRPGWAEQDPERWWEHVCLATRKLLAQTNISAADIKGIGIAYQMHGLVVVDKNLVALRPAIIWCDSRAVAIGNQAFADLGEETCLTHLLNSPGNFTAAKLKWVKDHEPDLYARIHRILLPGDYLAMRLTGEALTTPSGLSEGILWDFQAAGPAQLVLDHFGFAPELLPTVQPTFSHQGQLTPQAALATGLRSGIPVTYRAGDQPNNALALNVLNPGEVAATGGTSGVVYGVVDRPVYDRQSRVNSFVHVNHTPAQPRIGVLLCINGAGSQYRWVRQQLARKSLSYQEMNQLADTVAVGADGLRLFPFGNGAERMLGNRDPGAWLSNLQFNRHTHAHVCRAALEGIAFSFVYGIRILEDMGLRVSVMRVGNDNLFRARIFAATIANLVGCTIEVVETTGAVGAARAAGVGTGMYNSVAEAMSTTKVLRTYTPQTATDDYTAAWAAWEAELNRILKTT